MIRRVFKDAACREEGLAGTLQAVILMLDHRIAAAGKPSR